MLADLTVVDLGAGMAPALIAKFLAELGARVIRVEPPDGDPFYNIYPAYEAWRRAAGNATQSGATGEQLASLLANADVCLTGGEDHPDLTRRTDVASLRQHNSGLVILDIEAYPPGMDSCRGPAVDILLQARSGLVWEHFTGRPIPMSFSPTNYGAALRGLCGLLAALYERELSGRGQVVATSLFEGALTWVAGLWCDVADPGPGTNFVMPMDPYPLVFRCADGVYIHIVIGGAGSKYRMYQALDIDDPSVTPDDSGMPKPTDDPKNFFGEIDLLAEHIAKKPSRELLDRIWSLGLPAEPVLAPGACWDLPQIQHNGVIAEGEDGVRHVGHPIVSKASAAPLIKRPGGGEQPLSGVRVVDFGAFVAGPFASVVLADLGAEVVKVEPLAGDPSRSIFRSHTGSNRGKRAISLNMKDPAGIKIARELCCSADIITSNFRTGVAGRLGIAAAQLHEQKPELIALESPGYGSSGPLAERAGFDMVMQALCGHEFRAGGKANEPIWNRTSMVDYTGGLLGTIGTLAALYHRAHSGCGMALEIPLVNAGVYLLSELLQTTEAEFDNIMQLNATRTGFHPAEALYQTTDGWIAVAVRGEKAVAGLSSLLGLAEVLGHDPEQWDESIAAGMAERIAQWSTEEASGVLEAKGIWVEECRRNVEQEVLKGPDFEKAGLVQISVHPLFGKVRELGVMIRFSRSVAGHHGYAQLPGESSRKLLNELGKSEDRIAALLEQKVVA